MGPKKQLGQHFLTSPAYAEKIAQAVPAGPEETVLEIGPGRGALTQFLTKRFTSLHCVEIDADAITVLTQKIDPDRIAVHRHDILTFDYASIGFPLHVVGNLPYGIGARIIKKTLMYGTGILSLTVMLQREVARRIVAAPGSHDNGFLSIFCQFFGSPKIVCHVPPGAFFPRPKVDSTVISMIVDRTVERRIEATGWDAFFAFVGKGFSQRRKKLSKVIGEDALGRSRMESHLRSMGLDADVRPEDLGVDHWIRLYQQWTCA